METPRTDNAATDGWSGDVSLTPLEFTQQLEIELIEVKNQMATLKAELANFKQIAKGGDPVCDCGVTMIFSVSDVCWICANGGEGCGATIHVD